MTTLIFACGHELPVSDTHTAVPICACGERRIEHVRTVAPRIRGCATGPHVQTVDLPAQIVPLAVSVLKES